MRFRVRTLLITAFAVASMVPLAVFWFWPYSSILESKFKEVQERHLLLANNLGAALEIYHRDLVVSFKSFAPEIVEERGETAKPIFENLFFRHICVVDAETGVVTSGYFTQEYQCPSAVPIERFTMFKNMAAQEDVALSSVFAVPDEKPRLFMVTQQGESLVVAAIHTDFFKLLQKRINFGRNGHAAIVDHTGKALAHPSAEWEQAAFDLSAVEPVRRIIRGETGVETFYSPAMKVEMIAGFTTVPGAGWGVLVPQPISELEDAAKKFNRDAIVILSVGLMASLLLAAAVSTIFSRKIGMIADHLKKVSDGIDVSELSAPSPVIGVKELFALRQGVDRMAVATKSARKEIQERNLELEQTNEALHLKIDEREIAEAERRGSEARFRGLFDSAPIPIREEDLSGIKQALDKLGIDDATALSRYLKDNPDFVQECGDLIVVVDANRASLDLHGFKTKQQLLSKVTSQLSSASVEVVRQTILAIHAGKKNLSYEIPIYPEEGDVKRVASSWMVVAGHEDTYRRILLTSVDLTEHAKSEERILKAQKMEAVGQLTGGIAHDFNNLLTVIGGNADLIREDLQNAGDYVEPIQRAVLRGSELTQRLLAFSRQQPLAPKNVDLAALTGNMSELLRRTLGEDIGIELQYDTNLWHALADPSQIENALLNLSLNARDAMPNGGLLSVSCTNEIVVGRESDELEDGHYVVLSVRDNGSGMTEDALARAFEPFFTTKSVGKGSGLGLSMVYGFAKQSKGHAEIESVPNGGTTVRIFLPRGDAKLLEQKPVPSISNAVKGNGQPILILEDQDDVRSYLIHLLEMMGYKPVPAANAAEAADLLEKNADVQIALCDIMLPGGVSGTEFAAKAMAKYPELRVIFISGRPPVEGDDQTSVPENTVVLTKPFNPEHLADLLSAYANVP